MANEAACKDNLGSMYHTHLQEGTSNIQGTSKPTTKIMQRIKESANT